MKTTAVLIFATIIYSISNSQVASTNHYGKPQIIQISNYVRKEHFPWIGALYKVVNCSLKEDSKYLCGATILSALYSVTAAHCIQNKNGSGSRRSDQIILHFGIYDLKQKNSTRRELKKIFLHPDWNADSESYDSDIALLRLSESLIFSDYISPIIFWKGSREIFENVTIGTVISWTDPEKTDEEFRNDLPLKLHNFPEKYEMPIRTNSECFLKQPRFESISSQRTFCAGGLNSGPCLEVGNSGASMAVQIDGIYYLRGIVSASFVDFVGCDNITFTLFTDVSKFENWIFDIFKES